ncbi:hypothetical protein WA026_000821 [Henosepilachna vigintioctopunctata]|uniref:C2H2-type domain-containing protein n=1 Tax=Henosepilachna vigintioctopunctata TaxID=420089 RepID=A0AAW1UYV3_9CUCU
MNVNDEDGNEVIQLFIVDEEGNEVEVDQNYIKLEILNTDDSKMDLEYTDEEIAEEDAVLLDHIKVEVIDDPESEFGEFYLGEHEADQNLPEEIVKSEDENVVPQRNVTICKRKRGRPSLALLNGSSDNRPRKLHTCDVCGYTSHQKSHYRRHLTIHFKPEGIRCSICRKPMLAKAELSDHMEEHRCLEDHNRFQCNMCPYTSNKLTNVSQHTEVHYKPKKERLECERCSFATTNKMRFRNHALMHFNSKRSTKCPVCLMVFKSMSLRRRHIQRYKSPDDPTKYQCPECVYNTTKFNNFKQHMVVHRSEFEIEMFQCPYCPFKSKRKTDLRQHVIVKHKTDDEVTMFQCDFCSYESRRGNHLTSHMKNRHRKDIVMQRCGLCSYKTVSKMLIEKHFNIHSKIPEKFFLCSICGFGCQSQQLLDKHIGLNHTYENEELEDEENKEIVPALHKNNEDEHLVGYSCELMKVKQEKMEINSNEYTADFSEVAVYCCQFPQCKFMSNIERDAKIHMTICHNKRGDDNRCPECTFHTTSRYFYLDHLKVHDINIEHLKPHLCEICGTRWIRQGDLTRHMAVHWGSEGEKRRRVMVKEDETSNKRVLNCNFCSYKTRIRLCLYKHMVKHGKEQQLKFIDYVDNESISAGE